MASSQEDGVVERRQGSGTVVRSARHAAPRRGHAARPPLLSLVAGPEPAIDLSLAAPPSTELPLDHSISLHDIAAVSPLLGYAPMGLPILREKIAERFTAEGFPTTSEEILITSGAQQGISVIAALELAAGDHVAFESADIPRSDRGLRARGRDALRRSKSTTAAPAPTRCGASWSGTRSACCTSRRRARTPPAA